MSGRLPVLIVDVVVESLGIQRRGVIQVVVLGSQRYLRSYGMGLR